MSIEHFADALIDAQRAALPLSTPARAGLASAQSGAIPRNGNFGVAPREGGVFGSIVADFGAHFPWCFVSAVAAEFYRRNPQKCAPEFAVGS